MSSQFKPEDHVFYIILGLAGVALISFYHFGIYGLTDYGFQANGFWRLLAKELGMAIIIALILVYTIEKVTRDRHSEAADRLMASINENLFKSVFKRYIPEEVFKEVEDCLLSVNLYRTNYRINYTLRHLKRSECEMINLPHENDHLGLELYSSYTLHNVSETSVTEEITFGIEVPNEHVFKRLTQIKSFQIEDEDKIKNGPLTVDSDADGDAELKFKTTVTIPAKSSVIVTMEGFTVKRKIDVDIWASRVPSSGIEVQILAPEGCIVNCKANHSKSLIERSTSSSGPKIWALNHGMFPHQSIAIWWNFPSIKATNELNNKDCGQIADVNDATT